MNKALTIIKRVISCLLCIISVSTSIYLSIPTAMAASTLNTQQALNSPILSDNATTDNWNKWEIVCWGVFLSNFCQPFIDTYESAFTTNSGMSGTSNGAGLRALEFGTGRDIENNKIIQSFTEYAIQVEKETNSNDLIYVAYTHVEDNVFGSIPDPNTDESVLRQATVQDLLFKGWWTAFTATEGTTSALFDDPIGGKYSDYTDHMLIIDDAYVPTFYIKRDNKYIKIFDYTNSWDLQVISALVCAIRQPNSGDMESGASSTTYKDEFDKKLNDSTFMSSPLILDCFGNMVTQGKKIVVIPACVNQHLTTEPQMNILNSWFMNNYINTYDRNTLIKNVEQGDFKTLSVYNLADFATAPTDSAGPNGFCAFGGSPTKKISSLAGFYYDTDTIAGRDIDNGGYAGYGDTLIKLYECDINDTKNTYPIKFEVMSPTIINSFGGYINGTNAVAQILTDLNTSDLDQQPEILHEIVMTDGTRQSIFSSDPIAIPVQVVADGNDSATKNGQVMRMLHNWMYEAYSGKIKNTTSGTVYKGLVTSWLQDCETPEDLTDNMTDRIRSSFKSSYPEYKDNKITTDEFGDVGNNESFSSGCCRVILYYPTSNVMNAVSSVLGINDGAEFSTYSPYIYMTYLDWYGVFNRTSLTTGTTPESKFDPTIYDEKSDLLKVDPSTISSAYKSQEEKENEVLDMGYLMLHPEEGREYRKKVINNSISDFVYDTYDKLVYGGSSGSGAGASSKMNSGFLHVPTYDENAFTSFAVEAYEKIVVLLMGLVVLLIVIFGILKSRRLSWYVVSIFAVVNILLLLPAVSDITPYVVTNITTKVFSNNMTFWEISEGIENADLENRAYESSGAFEGMDDDATRTVLKMINQVSVIHTDRSLMFKQDISQKITQKLGGIYTDIQTIQSARWIIPVVMQQFSADIESDSYKYVYVKMSNVWDDATNIYWYYNPLEAQSATKATLTSQQFVTDNCNTVIKVCDAGSGNISDYTYGSQTSYFKDYEDVSHWADAGRTVGSNKTGINYQNYSYTLRPLPYDSDAPNVHTYFWLLHNSNIHTMQLSNAFGTDFAAYENADSWQKYIDSAKLTLGGSSSNWETTKEGNWESICEEYDRTNAVTIYDGYGYFRATESPYYYFFAVTKDSFKNDAYLGTVIGRLQGEIQKDSGGNEVRSNFMYATRTSSKETDDGYRVSNADVEYTPYIRDVLDLQCFFTNTVPYLYEMDLIAGGFDGESGILGDAKISDACTYYADTNQSWAYRCNWAIKLMENPNYSSPEQIKLADGTKVVVKNPMLPAAYKAAGRDMIFSEAQMYDQGLTEEALSLVELKCVEVNRKVAKNWTLLINYAGTQGLTKEVLLREMATSATEEFCREFSNTGLLDTNYILYPQSTDLRHLSFDAIMKMMLVNSTRNTSFAYGNSVQTLIQNDSLFSAIILLLDALMGAVLINFMQSVMLALIIVLAVASMIRSLMSGAAYKMKIAGATLIQNFIFSLYTILYYFFVSLFMSNSADEVLRASTIKAHGTSPIFVLILFAILSAAYIYCMVMHIIFLWKNQRDMGAEQMSFMMSSARQFLSDKLDAAGTGIQNFFSNTFDSESHTETNNTQSISGTGFAPEGTSDVNIKEVDGGSVTITSGLDETNIESSLADDNAAYSYEEVDNRELASEVTSNDINAEIEAGSELGNDN